MTDIYNTKNTIILIIYKVRNWNKTYVSLKIKGNIQFVYPY